MCIFVYMFTGGDCIMMSEHYKFEIVFPLGYFMEIILLIQVLLAYLKVSQENRLLQQIFQMNEDSVDFFCCCWCCS